MQNSEQQLAVLRAVDNCDLCITDKRLVVINPKSYTWNIGSIIAGAVTCGIGAPVATAIQKHVDRQHRKKTEPLKGLTIDELLQKDRSSYAVPYKEMDWLCLNRSRFGGNLTFRTKKVWKILKLNKEQVEQLSLLLPTIAALNGKFKIN